MAASRTGLLVPIRAGELVRVPDVSFTGAWAYWHRNAAIFRRTYKLSAAAWFIEPVVYLVAMGFGLGAYLSRVEGVEYVDFIAPGLIALSAMYGATFETTWGAFFKMERLGVYDACTSAPLSHEDVAFGEALWATTRAAMYGLAFLVIAAPFGVVRSWWALAAVPVVVVIGAMFSVLGLAYTYAIRHIDYLSFYWTLFITPQFMFSGTFFPLDRLPGWVEAGAWLLPLRHAVVAMRALVLQGDPAAAFGSLVWMAAVTAGLLALPLNLLRQRLVR